MGLFDFLKTDTVNLWSITDSEDFVIAMDQILLKKCRFGEKMQNLNPQERLFFIIVHMQADVCNGGFDQFFFNSIGDYASEIPNFLIEIGAVQTAEIYKKAFSAYRKPLPSDIEERRKMLCSIEDDSIDAILDACDNAFYASDEKLEELLHAYAVKNRKCFKKKYFFG